MMTNLSKELHEKFLAELRMRISERGKLANFLMDVLFIEKEAVYRRLRGEVPFSFAEVAVLAKKLHISVDNIFDITSTFRSFSFRLYGYNFFNMTEVDYDISRQYLSIIRAALNDPESEFGFAASIVPLHFSTRYRHIFRLYMLRWMYQFGNPGITPSYEQIAIPQKLQEYHDEYLKEIENIKQTYFIWDEFLMYYITNDVKYFRNIQLMTDKDVANIKNELSLFLDDLEVLAHRGTYDSGNQVELYVSNINFEATYTYLYSANIHLSMITTFSLSAATSLEKEACENIRIWIQSLKRTSTMISTSAEIDRAMFFAKQREFLARI